MTGTTQLPIRLGETDREAITEHFLALGTDDRRLRFGAGLSDHAIRALDERIDFGRDEIFGIADDDLRLLAVVHVAFYPAKAELGLSVLGNARGMGLGSALFSRAVMHLTNRSVRQVFVHCLSENGAMMHLARKNGMKVVREGPETDACLALPRATPGSIIAEWAMDQNSRFAHDMRRGTQVVLDALRTMSPRPSR
ncbi:MAG: GNAT family N-acetyltransferase [Betaproteobacteria bacterium]|nr:GNAT family N-acetyltransferase [Betaproteobacteria bacterium]